MNKNVTALILAVLAVGIYFTFTSDKIAELKSIQAVNNEYQVALNNSADLVRIRDEVLRSFNEISEADRARLNKIVPDTVDNVRLIIDVKDDIAVKHNLFLKNIKTTSPEAPATREVPGAVPGAGTVTTQQGDKFGVATLSFSVTASYEKFMAFLRDLESSLRIMDISKLTISPNDKGTYEFNVELKTYWLKQ